MISQSQLEVRVNQLEERERRLDTFMPVSGEIHCKLSNGVV